MKSWGGDKDAASNEGFTVGICDWKLLSCTIFYLQTRLVPGAKENLISMLQWAGLDIDEGMHNKFLTILNLRDISLIRDRRCWRVRDGQQLFVVCLWDILSVNTGYPVALWLGCWTGSRRLES